MAVNWLFFGSVDGGEAGGIILPLVQTCRNLGINPEEYLEDIFGRLMSHNSQKLQELLPDEWKKSREKNPSSSGGPKKTESGRERAAADDGEGAEARELGTAVEGESAPSGPKKKNGQDVQR